jgi:YVTN family beta-propeller protein
MRIPLLAICLAFLAAGPVVAGDASSQLAVNVAGDQIAVVDGDENVLAIIDATARKLVRRVDMPGKPQCVTWLGESNRIAVTIYDADAVHIVDAASGDVTAKINVGDEPYGLVTDLAGQRMWVTLDYPGEIVEVDVASQRVSRRLQVEPFLRGIALSPSEDKLFVTGYHTSRLHETNIGEWRVVSKWDGQPSDNLCRSVVVNPKGTKAYLSHIRSRTHVIHARGAIVPFLSVCDLNANAEVRRRGIAMDTYNGVYVTSNPWESAVSPDGSKLVTIYAGTDDMNVSEILDDGYREIKRQSIVQVGKNPRAVRFARDGTSLYIYQAVDFAVGVYDAATMKRTASVSLGSPTRSPEYRRGKELFNSAKPPMSNARWVSCSSCHPDGQADGRTWQNPEGLRRTPSLAGLAHTHPLHWSADRDEVQDFEYTIRGPLMGGKGLFSGKIKPKEGHNAVELEELLTGKSPDLDALSAYANSFGFTLSPHAAGPGQLTPAAERGKQIFFSNQTQCATCHSGPYFTDSRLQKPYNVHDVGTGDPDDKMGPRYDTPTLLGTYRNRAWLHIGKAATLDELLTKYNPRDQHGKTNHLSPSERADLIEFLRSLPYEPPPTCTPNTVQINK